MKTYIYTLKHPTTNQIRYVGQTNDPKRRLNRHINNSRTFKDKRHISNWIRSISCSPIMDIVEICDYLVRNEREEYWINYYKEQGFDLCNSSNGGAGAGVNNRNCVGRVISEETRAKMSKANKGRVFGRKGGGKSKVIYQYNRNSKTLIAAYKSIQEAVKATNINRSTIRRNIQGISSSKLFIWTDEPLH
jgi:hypothetical protein